MNYGDLIHDALIDRVETATFLALDFPTSRKRVTSCVPVKPKSIKAEQQTSAFIESPRNRQSRFRERSSWTWILEIHFNRAVSLEEFEDDIAQVPPRIARDVSEGRLKQVDIYLEEAEDYVYPPRKSASTGTRVRYRFVAELTPL